jgi:phage-related protein
MTAAKKLMGDVEKTQASAEMMRFIADFSKLLDQHIAMVRKILLGTVDQAMAGVMAINSATDFKMKKADEVLVQDKASAFVSKSAKDIDQSFKNPAEKVKHVHESLSNHMQSLSNLDDSVKNFVFSIMGNLSIDDVIRQRLEHVSTSLVALREGVQQILNEYSTGSRVNESNIEKVQMEMMKRVFSCFTMEEEKQIFNKVFGQVKGVNQKP